MTSENTTRRNLLRVGGAGLAVGLAGCSAFADGRGVPGRTEPRENGDDDGGIPDGVPQEVHDWLENPTEGGSGTTAYPTDAADETGSDSVQIMNGAHGGFGFDPVVTRIDPGTEVTWEWSGEGGQHNVSAIEGPAEFRSGDPIDEEGHTWSFEFEEVGNYIYGCEPHFGAEMYGAIVVVDEE